jgi:hypothetical protein
VLKRRHHLLLYRSIVVGGTFTDAVGSQITARRDW